MKDSTPVPDLVETQRFGQWWLWLALLVPLGVSTVAVGGNLWQQLSKHRSLDSHSAPLLLTMFLPPLFLVFFTRLALTVSTTPQGVDVRFVPFAKRLIQYGDIQSAYARQYNPLVEYGGWGVRGLGSNRAYNVSGNRGVQLELANGNKILLGSQRADDLAAAINVRMNMKG